MSRLVSAPTLAARETIAGNLMLNSANALAARAVAWLRREREAGRVTSSLTYPDPCGEPVEWFWLASRELFPTA